MKGWCSMGGHNKNVFRSGGKRGDCFFKIFGFMKKVQVYTKQDLIDFATENVYSGHAEKAYHMINHILSPREKDHFKKDGVTLVDARGNKAVPGHLYYNEKLTKVAGQKQKFRLRYRKEEMAPRRVSVRKQKVVSEKVEGKVEVPVVEVV